MFCRCLAAEKAFTKIEVFDQRPTVGGVWCATPSERSEKGFMIPRSRPTKSHDEPFWDKTVGEFQFLSPIYDHLETNIPYSLMEYANHSFPPGCSLFPNHRDVRTYLERYADEVLPFLKLGIQVLKVKPVAERKWSIETRQIGSDLSETQLFDAVVVANGHYDDPFVPDLPRIREWEAKFPHSISHSKYYRKPDDFKDKVCKTLVGNNVYS